MSKVLVVLSGGQDSATCLALAVRTHGVANVYAVTFYYGQRHYREVLLAQMLAERMLLEPLRKLYDGLGVPQGEEWRGIEEHWQLIDLSFLGQISKLSALTRSGGQVLKVPEFGEWSEEYIAGEPERALPPHGEVKHVRGQTKLWICIDDHQDFPVSEADGSHVAVPDGDEGVLFLPTAEKLEQMGGIGIQMVPATHAVRQPVNAPVSGGGDLEEGVLSLIYSLSLFPMPFAPHPTAAAKLEDDVGNQPSAFDPTLPNSFVPGRNMIFLSVAGALAANLKCSELWTGVCQTDYSGYPDCRQEFVESLEWTINFALGKASVYPQEVPTPDRYTASRIEKTQAIKDREQDEGGCQFRTRNAGAMRIVTPLMTLTKKETVLLMAGCGDDAYHALGMTHTCYNGVWPPCGKCPACGLRAKGFEEAGMFDPLYEPTERQPLVKHLDPLRKYTGALLAQLRAQFPATRSADCSPLVDFATAVENGDFFKRGKR